MRSVREIIDEIISDKKLKGVEDLELVRLLKKAVDKEMKEWVKELRHQAKKHRESTT
jgi:hypothetical protein